jgi:hypothetical protein
VDEDQALAGFDEALQVCAGLVAGVGGLPVLEVEDDGIVVVDLRGGEELGVVDHANGEARVLAK